MSRVIRVEMTQEDHFIEVKVIKEFRPEHGGGTQAFREIALSWEDAVGVLALMICAGVEAKAHGKG